MIQRERKLPLLINWWLWIINIDRVKSNITISGNFKTWLEHFGTSGSELCDEESLGATSLLHGILFPGQNNYSNPKLPHVKLCLYHYYLSILHFNTLASHTFLSYSPIHHGSPWSRAQLFCLYTLGQLFYSNTHRNMHILILHRNARIWSPLISNFMTLNCAVTYIHTDTYMQILIYIDVCITHKDWKLTGFAWQKCQHISSFNNGK